MARAGGENFPVASRLLPAVMRERLLAIYGFARLVDEIGDDIETPPAGRLAALDWVRGELDAAYTARAEHPVLARLQATLERCELPRQAFVRLIEANRADQRVSRYDTFAELRGYCHLSADPVGELVLHAFGAGTPARIELSDEICSALQLIEHLQDIGEDYINGRVYIPARDMRRFAVTDEDLSAQRTSRPLAALIALQSARAHELLDRGSPLIGTLRGPAKIAVAGFLAGGRTALGAIERAGYDVLGSAPRPGRARTALGTLTVLLGGGL
jgi:squalene synthase HpnC